jgi:uncharacterized protein YerC
MVYRLTGLVDRYKAFKKGHGTAQHFRDSLTHDELKRVENAESIAKSLLDMGKQYADIKDTLKPLFEIKGVESC